ncbi:hypothetical protein K402DRAFT_367111 [Aulographum hederae CBS 113979]|uniref:Chromatin modification-related protein n=1 Tax=Aulographum hederae CBS 113979 TaxID=1176131 RepID=A0A6G1HFF7_9PEZI|nr:hypothetical protein K402DRAFT_367111 [Aulographum hederae CBS 113979]
MSNSAPGRRQSARQIRSTRPDNYYARGYGRTSTLGAANADSNNAAPGFFPAITHFTDSVAALPTEVIKHFSMLKEVEAKVYGPDEELKKLAAAIDKLPHPSASSAQVQQQRQSLFYQMCVNIEQVSPVLDEKIAVLATANQTLAQQLARMESSYPHVATEVSEEARLGSLTHWAYSEKDVPQKKQAVNERPRREVVSTHALARDTAAMHEGDMAAAQRSHDRREAMLARKRQQPVDSDFDDRPPPKKPGKTKKLVDATVDKVHGLGIGAGGVPGKRRKNALPMERSISAALAGAGRGAGGSPRETPAAEFVKRRPKAPPGPAPLKKKTQTPNLSAQSPHLASSPLQSSFAPIPAITAAQRPPTSRGRQPSHANSAASETPRMRPSSSATRPATITSTTLARDTATKVAPTSAASLENTEFPPLDDTSTQTVTNDTTDTLKEEQADTHEQPLELDISGAPTRPQRGSKTATPVLAAFPTDVAVGRSRSTRNNNGQTASHASSDSNATGPGKRTQKKTAAAAAEERAKPLPLPSNRKDIPRDELNDPSSPPVSPISDVPAQDDDEENVDEEGEEGDEDDEEEPRYCYCNQKSYGSMVACDNEDCKREWFHLSCVGLEKEPAENEPWLCDECAAKAKGRGRNAGQKSRRVE